LVFHYVYVCRANERLKFLTMLVLWESGKRRIYPTIAWSSILFRGPKSDRSNVASTFTFVQGLGRLLWLLLYSWFEGGPTSFFSIMFWSESSTRVMKKQYLVIWVKRIQSLINRFKFIIAKKFHISAYIFNWKNNYFS